MWQGALALNLPLGWVGSSCAPGPLMCTSVGLPLWEAPPSCALGAPCQEERTWVGQVPRPPVGADLPLGLRTHDSPGGRQAAGLLSLPVSGAHRYPGSPGPQCVGHKGTVRAVGRLSCQGVCVCMEVGREVRPLQCPEAAGPADPLCATPGDRVTPAWTQKQGSSSTCPVCLPRREAGGTQWLVGAQPC